MTYLRKTPRGAALIVAAGLCSISLSAFADQSAASDAELVETAYEIVSDGVDRIQAAGRLPTLTQTVAATSCMLGAGLVQQEGHALMQSAVDEFEMIVAALKDGNADLGIVGPETQRRTIDDLDEVLAEWGAIRQAITVVLETGHDADAAHIIDDHNLALLELTTRLASDINGQYSHPYEISQRDALAIEFATRQRMLTQKMAKDACEIWTGYHADAAKQDLDSTMQIFENSLIALRDGYDAAGLAPAPTDQIRADLDALLSRWNVIKPNAQALLDGQDISEEAKIEIFTDLNLELDEIKHLVSDYADYAERHH